MERERIRYILMGLIVGRHSHLPLFYCMVMDGKNKDTIFNAGDSLLHVVIS